MQNNVIYFLNLNSLNLFKFSLHTSFIDNFPKSCFAENDISIFVLSDFCPDNICDVEYNDVHN